MAIADDAQDRVNNQLSLIRAGKWRSAWFTTFTFNAVFFEAYVLPALHEAGCDEIVVLVDEVFYLSSLAEAPRHAGTTYRLHPIALDGGVFHAKLTYLEGRNSADILMVGSGNMTWPGFGHQLECLDVLSSWRDARAFDDLAKGVIGLLGRQDLRAGEAAQSLKALAERAERAAEPYLEGFSSTRVLASGTEPISTQVSRHLAQKDFEELVVLSPFHAPDAGPVRRLASALQISRLGIAIDEATKATPVAEHVKGLHYLQRNASGDTRRTHAKWYEFRGKECWLLTGSVNATRASMETVANFEVAALRHVPKDKLPVWEPVKPKQFGADVLEIATRDDSLVALSASLQMHRLRGAFLKPGAHGAWQATLLQDGIIYRLGHTQVNEGRFEIDLAKISIEMEPCQLMLRQGARAASAWIMFEAELRMSNADRELSRRMRRLASADASPEDYHAVMAWLADWLYNLEPGTTARAQKATEQPEEEKAPPLGPFNYDRWHADESLRAKAAMVIGPGRAALEALATYARAASLGRTAGSIDDTREFEGAERSYEGTSTTQTQEQAEARHRESIEKALRRHLDQSQLLLPDVAAFMLEAFLWITTGADRRQHIAAMDCVPFLQWTAFGAKYLSGYPQYEPVAALTLSVCACGFATIADNDSRKERLCTLAQRTSLDPTAAREVVARVLAEKHCFRSMKPEEVERVEAAVEPLLAYRGFRAQLAAYLDEWTQHGGLLAPTVDLAQRTLGLASAMARMRANSREVRHWTGNLPEACGDKCYYRFPPSDLSVLRNVRALRCIRCGTLHFWTGTQ